MKRIEMNFIRVLAFVLMLVTFFAFSRYVNYPEASGFHIVVPFLLVVPLIVFIAEKLKRTSTIEEYAFMFSTNLSYLLLYAVRMKKTYKVSASMTGIALSLFSLLAMGFHLFEIKIGGYVGSLLIRGLIVSVILSALNWKFGEVMAMPTQKEQEKSKEKEKENKPDPRQAGF